MNQEEELEEWSEVQYIINASLEILDKNYEKSILILHQGIEENLKSENAVDSKRLLYALHLLITTVKTTLENNFGFQFIKEAHANNLKKICNFCGETNSEKKMLITGAQGVICNSCVKNIFNELEESYKSGT